MKLLIGVLYTLLPEFILFSIAVLFISYAARFGNAGLLATELASGLIVLLALALSLQFNHSRIFFALLTLCGLCAGLLVMLHTRNPVTRMTLNGALCLLVPLNLLVFSFSPERGVFSRYGASRFAILAIELLCVAALLGLGAKPVVTALHVHFFAFGIFDRTPLSQPGLLLMAIGLITLNDRLILRHNAELAAFFFALLASGIMLHRQDAAGTAVFAAAVAVSFAYAVIQESWDMAYLDELTGLPGRRALEEQMRQLAGQYAIAMLDVDHFKRFNDEHGHDVGDQVLRLVASRLQKHSASGKPFRYGGEEFCILFPGKQLREIAEALETLRADIETCRFEMRHQQRREDDSNGDAQTDKALASLAITVSIGSAVAGPGGADPWGVLKSADEALYAAKHAGRNRVCAREA